MPSSSYKAAVATATAAKASATAQAQALLAQYGAAQAHTAACKAAQGVAQAVAAAAQAQAHTAIAGVVGRCLTAVFDDPYTFQVVFEERRGKTDATLQFVRDGQPIGPLGAAGGGVVDMAAFALRLASLVLAQPQRRRLLVLDEPFKFVSAEYRGRVRALVEALASEMGVQFLLVTHIPELRCGTVVDL